VALCELTRVSMLLLAVLLARSTPYRQRRRPEPPVCNLAPALETGPVLTHVQSREGLVDTSEHLGSHLEQSEPDVSLGVDIGPFEIVVPIIRLASTPVADAALQLVLHLAPVLTEHLPQVGISRRDVDHGCLPRREDAGRDGEQSVLF
jgi:hypothetical protein